MTPETLWSIFEDEAKRQSISSLLFQRGVPQDFTFWNVILKKLKEEMKMEIPSVEYTVVWYNVSGIQGGTFGPFTSRRNAETCVAQLAARNEVKRAEIKEF